MKVSIRNGISPMTLAVALILLRLSGMAGLGITFLKAWEIGLGWGLVGDFAFALMPLAIAVSVGSFSRRTSVVVYQALAIALWMATLANLSYYESFKIQLELWTITQGSESIWSLRHFIINTFLNPWTLASLVCLSLSIFMFQRQALTIPVAPLLRIKRPMVSAFSGALLFTLALLLRESPAWAHFPTVLNSVLSDCIVHRWAKQLNEQGLSAFDHRAYKSMPSAEAVRILNAFALSTGDDIGENFAQTNPSTHSMERTFDPPKKEVQSLRDRLGFPRDSKINVVLLFLESTRAFEFYHPEIGPRVFPNLHQVMREHGILFRQTFSSATVTVEGQFASLCSTLNRQNGPAVYSSKPFLNIRCIQKLFAENGYERYWMNPYQKHYSGKHLFESRQGMNHFYDEHEFVAHSDEEAANSTEWGIGDLAFYRQAFTKLEDIHGKGKPFFAHILNTGTHGPWNRDWKGINLPADLQEQTKNDLQYNGYLKSFVGLDTALNEFFRNFFASPMSNDTVVVLVSDHGQSLRPSHLEMSRPQRRLLTPRILFGVVSKFMQHPEEILYPVSQVDVAPLLGTIADLHGEVTWTGRNPLGSRGGTPWISRLGDQFNYRTRKMLCLLRTDPTKSLCLKASSNLDPLTTTLEAEPEEKGLTQLLSKVIDANESLIENDSILTYPNRVDAEISDDSDAGPS